jgi:hypothetical protein
LNVSPAVFCFVAAGWATCAEAWVANPPPVSAPVRAAAASANRDTFNFIPILIIIFSFWS